MSNGTTVKIADMNAFDEVKPGKLMAQLKGALGRSDLFLFAGDAFPSAMKKNKVMTEHFQRQLM